MIKNITAFKDTVESAQKLADAGYIVTFGIKPSYPETGYGYIKAGESLSCGLKVDKFVEKPDLKTAQEYIENGSYYWNGGMFMGKVSVLLKEFEKLRTQIR